MTTEQERLGLETIGQLVGHYRILSRLGMGGMGAVYKAEDMTLGRMVALKVIKRDQRTQPKARNRFLREAKILSHLEHPNICRIYDYFKEDSNDFLVMELLNGRALSRASPSWLKSRRFAIAIQLATALAAAHKLGIVHRDLKPDNIMITLDDEVKILDFGVARMVEGDESSEGDWDTIEPSFVGDTKSDGQAQQMTARTQTVWTIRGSILGTPRFMSPEQALGHRATAASDLYSLGLIFQILFSGKPPYPENLTSESLLWKVINADTEAVDGVGKDISSLVTRLKSHAPAERPSAVEVKQQLQALADRPRRRLVWSSIVCSIAMLVITTISSWVGYRNAKSAEREARAARDEAQVVNGFLMDMLSSAQPEEKGIDVRVIDLLDEAVARVDERFEQYPMNRAAILYTLGITSLKLGRFSQASNALTTSLALRRGHLNADHEDIDQTMNALASALVSSGDYERARALYDEVVVIRTDRWGANDPKTLVARDNLAVCLWKQGQYIEAQNIFLDVWKERERVLGPDHMDTLSSMNNCASAYQSGGEYDQAERVYRMTLERKVDILGEDHPSTLVTAGNLGSVQYNRGEYDEAAELFRRTHARQARVLGSTHPRTLVSLGNLALCLNQSNQHGEAIRLHREILDARLALLGSDHPMTLNATSNLTTGLMHLGRYREAAANERDCLNRKTRILGPRHPDTLDSMVRLGASLHRIEAWEEAEQLFQNALRIAVGIHGEDHPKTRQAVSEYRVLLKKMGREGEGGRLLRDAQENQPSP